MRYILNDSGYIEAISFNNIMTCNNKSCTEYTGTVPEGYESLENWSEIANINAYKIVDGNLTYDSEEDTRLQALWESQKANGTGGGINILDVYPIGSIYMSVNEINPSNLFGGKWEQLKDRFLLGSGDTYINGDIDGEAEHTLTVDEMPSHSHLGWWRQVEGIGNEYVAGISDSYEGTTGDGKYVTRPTGGNQPHNNMPPYLVVNMWKRIG